MTVEITAWYDEEKREKVSQDQVEIYYYMIHASHPLERIHWFNEWQAFPYKISNSNKAALLKLEAEMTKQD